MVDNSSPEQVNLVRQLQPVVLRKEGKKSWHSTKNTMLCLCIAVKGQCWGSHTDLRCNMSVPMLFKIFFLFSIRGVCYLVNLCRILTTSEGILHKARLPNRSIKSCKVLQTKSQLGCD